MNNVTVIGRLVKDPELRYTSVNQTAVATFTLAVNRPFAKEGQTQADFLRIVVYGKAAENCANYLFKGSMVGIEGRIQTGSYVKDGTKYYTTDIVANRVEFLSKPKSDGQSKQGTGQQDQNYDPLVPEGFYDMDDDEGIPF